MWNCGNATNIRYSFQKEGNNEFHQIVCIRRKVDIRPILTVVTEQNTVYLFKEVRSYETNWRSDSEVNINDIDSTVGTFSILWHYFYTLFRVGN